MERRTTRHACAALAVALLSAMAVHGQMQMGGNPFDGDSYVKNLTPDTFYDLVGNDAGVLVKFYTPWCGHCKRLAPEFELVGHAFRKSKKVHIAKVNADSHGDFAKTFGVTGYPALKWFPAGETQPSEMYEGTRTSDAIIQWVNGRSGAGAAPKKVASAVVEVVDMAAWNNLLADPATYIMLELYAPWCGHCKALAPDWEKLGNTFAHEDEVVVAKADATLPALAPLKAAHVDGGFPTIKLFGKGARDEPVTYEGGRTAKEMVEFVNEIAGTTWELSGVRKRVQGRVPIMASMAEQFMKQKGQMRDMVVQQAQGMADNLPNPRDREPAQYYVKVIKKIAEHGEGWVENEMARLRKLMTTVSPDKVPELKGRINALQDFVPKKPAT